MAVAALVLGILALVLGWVPILGWILALLGFIFGLIAVIKGQKKGMAWTGFILSIIGGCELSIIAACVN
ncbi:MAG: hypothetical protein KBT39_04865 [Bacteroidales bacterium]|nr:hypothetical protein [Bacteroidales bacterium]